MYWVIYLAADNLLEMVFQVDAELEGIAKLGEGERLARRATLHHEGVVLGIGEVAHPEVQLQRAEIALGVGAQGGVEVLADGVGLVPIGLSLGRKVESDGDIAKVEAMGRIEERRGIDQDLVVGSGSERMLRHEGHVVVLVADGSITDGGAHRVGVVVEAGRGESIGQRPREALIGRNAAQARLQATGVALGSIGHHAAETISARHDGDLLVAYLHIERGEVELQARVEQVEMGAKLIVPGGLGLIGDGLGDAVVGRCVMVDADVAWLAEIARGGLELTLKDVREHLDIVASGTIALGKERIDVACLAKVVGQSDLRQKLVEMVALVVGERRTHRRSHLLAHDAGGDIDRSTGLVVDGHVAVVVAEAEGGRQAGSDLDVALMIDTEVVGRRVIVAGHVRHVKVDVDATCGRDGCRGHTLGERSCHLGGCPLRYQHVIHLLLHGGRDGRIGRLGSGGRQSLVHGLAKVDGGVGAEPLIGSEGAESPVPNARATTLDGELLRKRVLQLFLRQAHIVLRLVVDIHQHAVVEQLVGRRAGRLETLALVGRHHARVEIVALVVARAIGVGVLRALLQSVVGRGDRGGSDHVGRHQFAIGETVLVDMLIVGDEVERPAGSGTPREAHPAAKLIHLIGALTIILVGEKTVGTIVES